MKCQVENSQSYIDHFVSKVHVIYLLWKGRTAVAWTIERSVNDAMSIGDTSDYTTTGVFLLSSTEGYLPLTSSQDTYCVQKTMLFKGMSTSTSPDILNQRLLIPYSLSLNRNITKHARRSKLSTLVKGDLLNVQTKEQVVCMLGWVSIDTKWIGYR